MIVLQQRHISIVAEESSTIERQEFHTLELIFDARDYSSINDGQHATRSQKPDHELNDLRRDILAEILDVVTLSPAGTPFLKIRRVMGLYKAYHAYQIAQQTNNNPLIEHSEARVRGLEGLINLPLSIRAALATEDEPQRYLVVSDTKDRYLRVYFFRPSDPLLAVTLEYKDKVGAMRMVTSVLKDRGFNILTSLARTRIHESVGQYELVLEAPKDIAEDENRCKAVFEGALCTISDNKIFVSYELAYSGQTFKEIPTVYSGGETTYVQAIKRAASRKVLTIDKIMDHLSRFEHRLHDQLGHMTEDDYQRYRIAQELLIEEQKILGKFDGHPTFFISCVLGATGDAAFKKIIETWVSEHNTRVKFGTQLGRYKDIRDGVIRRIEESTAFLGVWTKKGGNKLKDGQYWPSPWLHWELGVAAARGKPIRLLISDEIKKASWRIYSDIPHVIFSEYNFEEKLQEALSVLKRMFPSDLTLTC